MFNSYPKLTDWDWLIGAAFEDLSIPHGIDDDSMATLPITSRSCFFPLDSIELEDVPF